ncbi:MAG: sigma 54-interacting transcriptional regulator [Pseudomonadota bacterium]
MAGPGALSARTPPHRTLRSRQLPAVPGRQSHGQRTVRTSKGSFTGATSDRKGCFETGDGGVVFLDEIADLHMSAQVMLLRALAAGEFQPLGADFRRQVNVRVITATNRPIEKLLVAREFRHDLLFRLRYLHLNVPPLRERGDDWLLLLDYALDRLHRKYGVAKRFSRDSLDRLAGYDWPGNVRQVMSVAAAGYALADGLTRWGTFVTPVVYEGMIAFIRTRCARWVSFVGETRGTEKRLVP